MAKIEALFDVGGRYSDLLYIGRGSSGIVCSAVDKERGRRVAIKRSTPFTNTILCWGGLREITILQRPQHKNIIDIDITIAQGKVMYMVQTSMETDMEKLLRKQRLSDSHICYFLYQVLCGLKYIHSANVVHRDIKPNNLLLNSACDLKICDFGMARVVHERYDHEDNEDMTEYVCTQWYRAPDVMLILWCYNKAIDIWSVGCVLGEMFNNKLVLPSEHYVDHMVKIIGLLGTPSDLEFINNKNARSYLASLPYMPGKPWSTVFPTANSKAIDLLEKLLAFNPMERLSAEYRLAHPYFEEYSEPEKHCRSYEEETFDSLPMEKLTELIYLASK